MTGQRVLLTIALLTYALLSIAQTSVLARENSVQYSIDYLMYSIKEKGFSWSMVIDSFTGKKTILFGDPIQDDKVVLIIVSSEVMCNRKNYTSILEDIGRYEVVELVYVIESTMDVNQLLYCTPVEILASIAYDERYYGYTEIVFNASNQLDIETVVYKPLTFKLLDQDRKTRFHILGYAKYYRSSKYYEEAFFILLPRKPITYIIGDASLVFSREYLSINPLDQAIDNGLAKGARGAIVYDLLGVSYSISYRNVPRIHNPLEGIAPKFSAKLLPPDIVFPLLFFSSIAFLVAYAILSTIIYRSRPVIKLFEGIPVMYEESRKRKMLYSIRINPYDIALLLSDEKIDRKSVCEYLIMYIEDLLNRLYGVKSYRVLLKDRKMLSILASQLGVNPVILYNEAKFIDKLYSSILSPIKHHSEDYWSKAINRLLNFLSILVEGNEKLK